MEADRCRLVVIASPGSADLEQVMHAASTGIPQTIILHQSDATEPDFARYCVEAVRICHQNNMTVLVVDDTQIMGRAGADGVLVNKLSNNFADLIGNLPRERIIGRGGFRDRHGAMMAGETNPDFIFIGKPGGDIRPEAHPKNLKLAEWWSGIIEIPCVVMAGNTADSILKCAATGADFVAVEKALFNSETDAKTTIEELDALLEEHAPRFMEQPA